MQALMMEEYEILLSALDELDSGVDISLLLGKTIALQLNCESKLDFERQLAALVANAERETKQRSEQIALLKAKLILMRNKQEKEELLREAERITSMDAQ